MKGKLKKALCGILASAMLLSVPVAAQAETIIIAGIETEVVKTKPPKATNSKINTKAKTVTLYAGLSYGFQGNGFKRAKVAWKISNKNCATLKSYSNGGATVTTKKAGRFTITAQQGKKKYTYKVTVKEDFSKRCLSAKLKDNKVTWSKVPGADGYLVCRQYFSECGIDPYGWKDQDIVVLEDLKGNSVRSFDISTISNWQFLHNNNWFLRVKAYQKSNGKIIYTSDYPEDMTFNTVKLR